MATAPAATSKTAVPINAPALFIVQRGWPSGAGSDAGASDAGVKQPPTLTSGTTTIALTEDGALHRLTAQPTPGEWTWRFWDTCRSEMTTRVVTFAASAPIPDALPPVTASAPNLANITVADSGGGCVSGAEAMVVSLTVDPGPALGAWWPVMQYRTLVDGEPWGGTPYEPGAAEPAPAPGPIQYSAPRQFDRVFSVCRKSSYSVAPDLGVAPGTHVIEVQAVIAGGTVIKAKPIEVTFTCPSVTTTPDAGSPPPDSGAPSAAPSEDAGCALGHASASRGTLLLGALALAVAHARRRRQ